MPSTVIRHFTYDAANRRLDVTFVSGRRYVYFEVPEHVANDFRAASSRGAFFNAHVRDAFAYREVERSDADR